MHLAKPLLWRIPKSSQPRKAKSGDSLKTPRPPMLILYPLLPKANRRMHLTAGRNTASIMGFGMALVLDLLRKRVRLMCFVKACRSPCVSRQPMKEGAPWS